MLPYICLFKYRGIIVLVNTQHIIMHVEILPYGYRPLWTHRTGPNPQPGVQAQTRANITFHMKLGEVL